mgnify:CR=1 FL=1
MPEPCAYFRGEYMNPKDAKIGIMTHAFHYGTGTFGGINATWDAENERFCLFRMLDHYRRPRNFGPLPGADREVDATVVVSAPADIQRARVLARPGMSEAQLDLILARQTPDAEKRARATHVIGTETLDGARAAVRNLIRRILADHA